MTPDPTRRRILLGIAAVAAVALLAVGGFVAAYQTPTVVNTSSHFGAVSTDAATVHARIVVRNPNDRAVPGGVDLAYTTTLNGVEVAHGGTGDVSIPPGRTVLETTATFDNTRIPEWWVTHVARGEHSRLRTTARVGLAGLPVGPTLTVERSNVTTSLLSTLTNGSARTVRLGETPVLRVLEQRGVWGEATAERTPIVVTTTLRNVHDRPVELAGTDYVVRMNDVVVGRGETTNPIVIQPGATRTYEVRAVIDPERMQRWWVSHLRANQTTDLAMTVFAAAEVDGERTRIPLAVFQRNATFRTDLLGTGAATVALHDPAAPTGPSFVPPRVRNATTEWGDVREDATEIHTTLTVRNPNDGAFADILAVDAETRTTVAGVTAAEGTTRIETLPRGTGTVELVSTLPHDRVPEWWAAHLANGERSRIRTINTATADVAVTGVPLNVSDRRSTLETDFLAGLEEDATRTVRSDRTGAPVLTVHSTDARWVDPTPATATVLVTADLENDNPFSPVTIRNVSYTIDLNDVSLADDRLEETYTLAPGERRTVQFAFRMDVSRTAKWWPAHVRRGERSTLNRTVTATVETDGGTERRTLGFLSGTSTIRTDLLAE